MWPSCSFTQRTSGRNITIRVLESVTRSSDDYCLRPLTTIPSAAWPQAHHPEQSPALI